MNILRLLFRRRIARLGCVLLTAILLSPDLAQAQQSAAARIQRLEDIEEIRTVLTNYGRLPRRARFGGLLESVCHGR